MAISPPACIKGDCLFVCFVAETKGRWWIVGSAWNGSVSNGGSEEKQKQKQSSKTDSALTFDEKLLNLARKHRMSTDIRKNIFCILMSAEVNSGTSHFIKVALRDCSL